MCTCREDGWYCSTLRRAEVGVHVLDFVAESHGDTVPPAGLQTIPLIALQRLSLDELHTQAQIISTGGVLLTQTPTDTAAGLSRDACS